MKNIDDMIEELLDAVDIKDDNTIAFSDESKQLIHDISQICKDFDIVKQNAEKSEEYAKGLTAEQIYIDMLNKIVAAPTRLHMLMSARMLIPVINKKLQDTGGVSE